MRPGPYHTWLAAAAIVMVWTPLLLLLPPPVAGQGLSISPEQLGAGEAAVVSQFNRFEEILDLYSQSTGGRGRGRGGTTSTTGGTSFRSVESLQQLQLHTYHLAGSPPAYNSWNTSQNPGGISLLPGVRDQLDCDSCVAQAIAAAIQAAAAAAWRQNADQARFDVSAASLCYCSEGGKTCSTGWDLQEALTLIIDKGQYLIRPTDCAGTAAKGVLDNPSSERQINDWKPACQEAAQACSNKSSPAQPWLSCSYKSLSSFVDIQRHIRQHGSVVTRITIYDDFWKHFNVTTEGGAPSATVSGATHPAYNRTADSRSKPLFGHAAVIVGYNNTELTWTLLNSYGKKRFTLDGLFKIAMGVAGVAVPDQTFGIECKPAPGGPDDLHSTDWLTPWIKRTQLKPRKPVDYWDRANDWNNLNASCYRYRYNMTAGDTMSSVADAFGVSLQQLVRDNQALFPLGLVNYTLNTGTRLKDLQMAAAVANQLRLDNGSEPYFVCRTRKEGQPSPDKVICRQSDLTPCAGSFGPCKIVYSEADVSVQLAPGTALKVCGISRGDKPGAFDRVAYLKEPKDSQPRALKVLLQALPGAPQNTIVDSSSPVWQCYVRQSTGYLRTECLKNGVIKSLGFLQPPESEFSVHALMNLHGLAELQVSVTGGTLPPQLGALKLGRLEISIRCSSKSIDFGPLPNNWFLGVWHKSLGRLHVWGENGIPSAEVRCGVTGSLPARWFEPPGPAALTALNLPRQQLTGSLPEALPKAMPGLEYLDLSFNSFVGSIPALFSSLSLDYLDLSSNKLFGALPLGLKPATIWLDNNPGLAGCVPNAPGRDGSGMVDPINVKYENTGITGLCEADAETQWLRQRRAALDLLPGLLGLPVDDGRQLVTGLKLPQSVVAFVAKHPDATTTSAQDYSYSSSNVDLGLQVINGVPCIVTLSVRLPSDDKAYSPVDMRALPGLLRWLPYLEQATFQGGGWPPSKATFAKPNQPSARYQLPADLPIFAPSLRFLVLSDCGLTGTIPDWKKWTSLEWLELDANFLSGTLPEWQGMNNLRQLMLSTNDLQGMLPAAWVNSMPARANSYVDLSGNPGIGGPIPDSWWQHFSGVMFNLQGTSLAGCKPPGWWRDVIWSDALADAPFCGEDEVAFLQQAKQLLQTAMPSLRLSSWRADGGSTSGGSSGGSTLPAHCRTWQGITCNGDGQVTGVDLSSLKGAATSPLNMTALLQSLAGIKQLQILKLQNNPQLFAGSSISTFTWSAWPKLQHLDVSNCGLTGSLPSSLGVLPGLAHLNTSHNPGMSGPLPELLGGATSLAVLDAFECGVSGSLPVGLATLPLQVLHVGSVARPSSADGSISGPLPPEYGLISTLRELHIINTWVTGGIPSAWFDPSAAVSAAAAEEAAAAPTISAEQDAAEEADAAEARMTAAWQRVQDRLKTSSASSSEGAAAAAVAAPAGDGLSMQQLEVLVLSGNTELEGRLPPQLSASQQLKVLRLSGSKLTGPLPGSYGRLKQLRELDLSGNQLSGSIPALWLGLRSLSLMDLSGNPAIGGALPATLFNLAGPGRSLRCVRLFGTGADGQWNQTAGGVAAIKAAFEGAPGSQVKVAISSNAPEC